MHLPSRCFTHCMYDTFVNIDKYNNCQNNRDSGRREESPGSSSVAVSRTPPATVESDSATDNSRSLYRLTGLGRARTRVVRVSNFHRDRSTRGVYRSPLNIPERIVCRPLASCLTSVKLRRRANPREPPETQRLALFFLAALLNWCSKSE